MVRGSAIALKHQLIVALVVPAVLVVGVTAIFADQAARRALESALGDRLASIAEAAAAGLDPNLFLLEKGEDEFRSKRNALVKLRALRDATGIERIVIVRFADKGTVVDTSEELKIGEEFGRARFDRTELEKVETGESTTSVLFDDRDGRRFKTGYAPVRDNEEKIVGFAAVDGRANFFDAIDRLRTTMTVVALLGCALLFFGAFVSARRVSVPLQRLSDAAARIGEGHLDTFIPSAGPKEAEVLAATMRAMATSLALRDKEMQMMLAGIAHEVRNPLGGIELFGGLLREDLGPDDPRQKHVDKIMKELGTLGRVVNDFLDFVRKAPLDLKPARLAELFDGILLLVAQDATSHGVEVTNAVAPDVLATVDAESFKRAILNLVRNGVQAAPRGGYVRIEARGIEARGMEISVADNGPGVPVEKRADIFQAFYTTKQKGTGLGLALVKKTVDAHGAKIRVEETDGGGATFTISLPPEPNRV